MQAAAINSTTQSFESTCITLTLAVNDPGVLVYLSQFADEGQRNEKALEALRVGVVAIQSARPSLDAQIVQAKFAEIEARMKDQLGEFQAQVGGDLVRYFAESDGVVPKSIDGIFGENGTVERTLSAFFDPADGKLSRLIQAQVGPQSDFGKVVDPQNRQGFLALVETRIQTLVETKLNEVLLQFSLDNDGSAMNRLHVRMAEFFGQLNQSLGIRDAVAAEANRGHVKGLRFEEDVYAVVAGIGAELGDQTELVRGKPGINGKDKTGDIVATLGETSGFPDARIVFEVKDQTMRFKDAISELKEAKKNRGAKVGILVFAKGREPVEVGDFRRVGEDFYVSVDKEDLESGKPLLFLDAAYKIARAQIVAAKRTADSGAIDLHWIEEQLDSIVVSSERLSDMAAKARMIQGHGKTILEAAEEMKADFTSRLRNILRMLRAG